MIALILGNFPVEGTRGQKDWLRNRPGLRNPMARPLEPKGPNAGQIRFWNEAGIAYYFSHRDAIRAERAPLPGG